MDRRRGCAPILKTTLNILESLGFIINWEKSTVIPSKCIEYLGIIVDSDRLYFSLPSAKVRDVIDMCKKALADGEVSLRTVASILGNITWQFRPFLSHNPIIEVCKTSI